MASDRPLSFLDLSDDCKRMTASERKFLTDIRKHPSAPLPGSPVFQQGLVRRPSSNRAREVEFSAGVCKLDVSRKKEPRSESKAAEDQYQGCKNKLGESPGSSSAHNFCRPSQASTLRLVSPGQTQQEGEGEEAGEGDGGWTEVGPRARSRRWTDYSGETAGPALDVEELREQRKSFHNKAMDARGLHNQVGLLSF